MHENTARENSAFGPGEDERIRAKAHEIWICEGCPEGRSHIHWEMAAALVRMTRPTAATDQSQASSAVMIAFRTARTARLAAAATRPATARRRGKPHIAAAE